MAICNGFNDLNRIIVMWSHAYIKDYTTATIAAQTLELNLSTLLYN